MNYKIEVAKQSDILQVGRLYDDINDYLEGNINYPGWKKGIYPTVEEAKKGVGNGLYVLKIDDEIIGSIILTQNIDEVYRIPKWSIEVGDDDILLLRLLVVHPDYMKKGLSQILLQFAVDFAKKIECKTIRLAVTTSNTLAMKLYENWGFKYIETVDSKIPDENLKWFRCYELIL